MRLNKLLHSFGVKILYHSDGAIMEALEGLIDMGIDILEALSSRESFNDQEFREYVLHVHGMKSVLAQIGETGLSGLALELEKSGRNRDIETILSKTPSFTGSLRKLVEKFVQEQELTGSHTDDMAFLHDKLNAIGVACEMYDANSAGNILTEIQRKTWSQSTGELLNTIAEHLLFGDFDKITEIVSKHNKV